VSEYQYYEFRAIDRRLSTEEQRALRDISTRAITATTFVNEYNWGDFRGDPDRLMERYFDLFLYTTNWGSRRLSMRLPIRIVDAGGPMPDFAKLESVRIRRKGEHLILDMWRDEVEEEDLRDDEQRLGSLEPLRNAALDGDPSILYLAWLPAVDGGEIPDGGLEPAIGLGAMSPALETFAEFFGMDLDLVEAAAGTREANANVSPEVAKRYIRSLPNEEKVGLLLRLHAGEGPQLGAELRQRVRSSKAPPSALRQPRSVAELRARAAEIAARRARQAKARAAAERKRQEQKEAAEQERRLDALAKRGRAIWRDVELEIARRNEHGYDQALALLKDLRVLANRQGWAIEFAQRLATIRRDHVQKKRFLERLSSAGMGS
jgi:hypothetical protein